MTRRLHILLSLPALLLAAHAAFAQPARPQDPKQDEKTAMELRKRFEQGDSGAALRLANLIAEKRVSEARHGKPVDWYRKGCALHDMSACHNLGLAYQNGSLGLPRDHAEAAEYYARAANLGLLNSMYSLAILYADTSLTANNPGDGLMWMLLAQRSAMQCPDRPLCKTVLQDPMGYRKRLEDRLSSREMREAYRKAEAWRPVEPPSQPRQIQ